MSADKTHNLPVKKDCSIPGKQAYTIWGTLFELDDHYVPIKAIGKGAYGVVCSAKNTLTGEKVAIKKIQNAFENLTDARRTLREIKLLRHLKHENVIAVRDILQPVDQKGFRDVYIVYELMDTDLHQIIRSPQQLNRRPLPVLHLSGENCALGWPQGGPTETLVVGSPWLTLGRARV